MFVVGALQSPLQHYFYKPLDKWFAIKTASNICYKLLIDQLFMPPLCIVLFITTVSLLEGKTLLNVGDVIIEKFPPLYVVSNFWENV